jgi:carotenoid 1,2-hydratase
MTERGRGHVRRDEHQFIVGPSRLRWTGDALAIDVDERSAPWGRRVHGRIVVRPQGIARFVTALDADGRHRWGPIAPCARVEVDFAAPALRWRGHAYLDSNEGDEPIDAPFREWDWQRATFADGRTAVVYDVQPKDGPARTVARLFRPDGGDEPFEPPPTARLPSTGWRIARTGRGDDADVAVRRTLEDTPFYARSELGARWLGEPVTPVHETLVIPRLVSPVVQRLLPFRMPRRA